jgi:hypothetical protein
VGFKEFAHPAVQTFSAVAVAGPTFFLAAVMFSFVIQISSLITERELKLRQVLTFLQSKVKNRIDIAVPSQNCSIFHFWFLSPQAMNMMGLYDSAYWLSWLTWEGFLMLLSSLFLVLFGMMFQFDFFLNNSFAVVYLVFFLFQLNMVRVFPRSHIGHCFSLCLFVMILVLN